MFRPLHDSSEEDIHYDVIFGHLSVAKSWLNFAHAAKNKIKERDSK